MKMFENESEIEFICYNVMRIVQWASECIPHCRRWQNRKNILEFVKFSCKSFPTNAYFLNCVELFCQNEFEIRTVYETLMRYANEQSKCAAIVWIKWMRFEMQSSVRLLCIDRLMFLFDDL